MPNKTFCLSPPNLESDLERHFWRGCVDGDGCICKIGNDRYRIDFIGTFEMVQGFQEFLNRNLNVNDTTIREKGNIFCVSYGKQEDVRKITKLLYKDSAVKLRRKYEIASRVISGGKVTDVKNQYCV